MRRFAIPLCLFAAGCGSATATAPGQPTVVELFQSQGCSSCPPANANLNAIADRPDVLALSFAVTYWDQLGWKDTFAKPAFTQRQWDYARAAGRAQVGTPQMIVDGATALVGGNRVQLDAAIASAGHRATPTLIAGDGRLRIGAGKPSRAATVWLVTYDPRKIAVPIRAGENGGRTLPHRNIVRSLDAVGTWNGAATTLTLPAASAAPLRRAVLVQEGRGGRIVTAARL